MWGSLHVNNEVPVFPKEGENNNFYLDECNFKLCICLLCFHACRKFYYNAVFDLSDILTCLHPSASGLDNKYFVSAGKHPPARFVCYPLPTTARNRLKLFQPQDL